MSESIPFKNGALWRRIASHAASAPARLAYLEQASGQRLTYTALVEHARNIAAAVDGSTESCSLLCSGNVCDFAPQFLGALLAGRAVLPVSPETPEMELQRLRRHASARGARASLLLTTSGTTAAPKIVRRSVASLDAVAEAMAGAIGFTANDRVIAGVPLVHSYGLEHGLLAPLWAGSTVVLCDGLDLQQLIAALAGGATILPTVPPAIELLCRWSGRIDAPALRRVYTAGAPLPAGLAGQFAARFGAAVGQVYGATEIGSVFYRDPARDTAASVGRAMHGVSIRILDPAPPHTPLSPGEDGEVAVRAPSMLDDYLDGPADLIDGYFRTGDIGSLSAAGELTLVGRARLLIDVGGAKVNPLEVERVLETHPGVAACVVLPLRLSETVCRVRTIIVPADPASPPGAAEIREYARAALAAYKVPRVIEFRSNLPRTPSGKIARRELETSECRA